MQLLIVITALVSFLSVAESARDIRLTQKVHKLEPRTESNSPRQQILDNKVSSDTASPTSILAEGDNAKFRGPLSIAGGTLAHLALGTFYCWGNFMSYAPDYIKFYDGVGKKGAQPDALLILPLTLVSICVTMPLGPSLVSKVGASRAMLIGSWLMSLGVLLASYAKSLSTFMLFYSVMVGAGVGLAYTAPMTAAWKWMPQVKVVEHHLLQTHIPLLHSYTHTLFQTHFSYRTIVSKCGTTNLSRTLNQILMTHIREVLPEIKAHINNLLNNVQVNLDSLGESIDDLNSSHKGAALLRILSQFAQNFRDRVDGKSPSTELMAVDQQELFGGARISYIFNEIYGKRLKHLNPLEGLSDEDIRTAIANANGTRPSLFVPEISFDVLVRKQIRRLEQPGE